MLDASTQKIYLPKWLYYMLIGSFSVFSSECEVVEWPIVSVLISCNVMRCLCFSGTDAVIIKSVWHAIRQLATSWQIVCLEVYLLLFSSWLPESSCLKRYVPNNDYQWGYDLMEGWECIIILLLLLLFVVTVIVFTKLLMCPCGNEC